MYTPYKYKNVRSDPAMPLNRVAGFTETEVLSGLVQNVDASALEERFARGLDAIRASFEGYEFRPVYIAGKNTPGSIEVDFLLYLPEPQPVQIDGEFTHKTAEQKTVDSMNDTRLNDHLSGWARPVIRLGDDKLQTQEDANIQAREVVLGMGG